MFPPFRAASSSDNDAEANSCGGGLFGRHRGGPFGGRRRGPRMFDSGALRLVVLGMIGHEPHHGYDIIKGLKSRFQGSYSPSPGSIYPMLQALAAAGLASSKSWGPKKLFTITEAGQAYLAEHRVELDAINAQLDETAAPIDKSDIGQAIKEFRTTLFQKMRKGSLSPEQAAKLRETLLKARDEIEQI
jgi:DNA-binding PadR family transcriptional regulator